MREEQLLTKLPIIIIYGIDKSRLELIRKEFLPIKPDTAKKGELAKPSFYYHLPTKKAYRFEFPGLSFITQTVREAPTCIEIPTPIIPDIWSSYEFELLINEIVYSIGIPIQQITSEVIPGKKLVIETRKQTPPLPVTSLIPRLPSPITPEIPSYVAKKTAIGWWIFFILVVMGGGLLLLFKKRR